MLGSPTIGRYHGSLPEPLDPQAQGLSCYGDRILTQLCAVVKLSYVLSYVEIFAPIEGRLSRSVHW